VDGISAKVSILMSSLSASQSREAVLAESEDKCIADKGALSKTLTSVRSGAEVALATYRKDMSASRIELIAAQERATVAESDEAACRDSIAIIQKNAADSRAAHGERLQQTLDAMSGLGGNSDSSAELALLRTQKRSATRALYECEAELNSTQVKFAPDMCQDKMIAVDDAVREARSSDTCALCASTAYDDILFEAEIATKNARFHVQKMTAEAQQVSTEAEEDARYLVDDAKRKVAQIRKAADADAAHTRLQASSDADKTRADAEQEVQDMRQEVGLAASRATAAASRIKADADTIAAETASDAAGAAKRILQAANRTGDDIIKVSNADAEKIIARAHARDKHTEGIYLARNRTVHAELEQLIMETQENQTIILAEAELRSTVTKSAADEYAAKLREEADEYAAGLRLKAERELVDAQKLAANVKDKAWRELKADEIIRDAQAHAAKEKADADTAKAESRKIIADFVDEAKATIEKIVNAIEDPVQQADAEAQTHELMLERLRGITMREDALSIQIPTLRKQEIASYDTPERDSKRYSFVAVVTDAYIMPSTDVFTSEEVLESECHVTCEVPNTVAAQETTELELMMRELRR